MACLTNWIKLKENFAEPPILAFKRNKNLRSIIRGNKVFDNKKSLKVKKFNKAKYQPCFTRSINLCCKQLKTCSTFQSAFSNDTFLIRHNITCKSSCVIYLMECCFCEKSQYVGKSEYSLHLRINTHRNDVWRKVETYHLITLKALLDPFGSHIKTHFHTSFCSFYSLSNLVM